MALAIFDLDNTLIDRQAAFRRWTERFAARHHLAPTEIAWLEARDGDGFTPREQFVADVIERYGLPDSADELLRAYREEILTLLELEPQAPAALAALRAAGWRLAIATNGSAAQQWAKIRSTGLDGLVDAVAVSEEVGVSKPERRMFEVAAERCGARLSDGGWMVGDCPLRDIAGGQAAGLRTVWMRRGREWDASAQAPDGIADTIAEAGSILR